MIIFEILKQITSLIDGKPHLSVLSQEDKDFFLNSVSEDIKNNHIVGNTSIYELIIDNFIKNGPFQTSTDGKNIALVYIYVLKKRKKTIGCSMIYCFPDYIEIMYIHISREFRRRGFGCIFQKKLETLVPPNTRMRIRCLSKSTEGIILANKMKFKLVLISDGGTRIFEKIKV